MSLDEPERTDEGGAQSPHRLPDLLRQLGCPAEKCDEMAAQLDKRARQLVEQQGRSYEQALAHLLALMKQGWAAKERGL